METSKDKRRRRQKNTWKLVILKLARYMILIIPVLALYYTEHGLSLIQITLLQSIFSAAYFLLEIPTGYISDRYGRKASIIIGTSIGVIGYLTYRAGNGFWSFAIAEVILALGWSCISGSDSALLYDTLKQAGKAQAAKKREGRINFAGDMAGVISGAVAGFIGYYYGYDILWIITAIIVASTIPIAFTLEEISDETRTNRKYSTRKDMSQISTTLKSQPRILRIILYTGIIGYATYSLVWSQQQWMQQLGAPVAWLGVIWGLARMSVAGAGLSAHWYDEKLGHIRSLGGLLIGLIAGFIIIASGIHWIVVVIGLCMTFAMRGLQQPLSSYYVNQQITSDLRATTLSVMSMIHRMIFAIALPLQGWLGDTVGLQKMFIIMTCIFAITGGATWLKLRSVTRKHLDFP